MTSENKVLAAHPKAKALWNRDRGWGIFFGGGPRFIGIHSGFSGPDVYGNTKSNAWVRAAKHPTVIAHFASSPSTRTN